MKRKYRIKGMWEYRWNPHYSVQVKRWFGWVTIKKFIDDDMGFAKREAEELLEKLEEK